MERYSEPCSSLVSRDIQDKMITAKFTTDDDSIFTHSFPATLTLAQVKDTLGKVFAVAPLLLKIVFLENGEEVPDSKLLDYLDVELYGSVQLRLTCKDPDHKILAAHAYKDLYPVDVITVMVEDPCYPLKVREVVVEIEDRKVDKPFLGGYVNTQTHLEYHHGYSQTGPPPPKVPPWLKNHRDTQTYWYRSRKYDTRYDRATQMTTDVTWIPNINDKLATSGPYETADERAKRIDVPGKVRRIQRYFRAWKMRKALYVLSEEYKKRVRLEREYEAFLKAEDQERRRKEMVAKIFPRTKEDFRMLYAMVERWKMAEIRKICQYFSGPGKIAEFYRLLEKEIQLLKAIEHQRQKIRADVLQQREKKFFDTIGNPLKWTCHYKKLFVQMDTLETQKARQYRNLFMTLRDETQCKERRLQALLNVKFHLQNDNCDISNEIVDLIDRACVLITRGLSFEQLEMLQKRIEHLVFKHLNSRECNEGITNRMVRVKEKLMEENLFFCHRCHKLKTHSEFEIDAKTKPLKICISCLWVDRIMQPPANMAPYAYILKCIRREEKRKSAENCIAFVLQEKDIKYIIENIWKGHSAVSECSDIHELRLSRWDKHKEWAPWNCVLLTADEMKSHLRLDDLEAAYAKEFIDRVISKHAEALAYFYKEKGIETIARYDIEWDDIVNFIEFVAVNSKEKIFPRCH